MGDRSRDLATRLAGGVLGLVLLSVLLAPWLAPVDPSTQDLAARLAGPSAEHWLGTDQLGRDVLSRVLHGGRFSLAVAAVATVLTAVVGTAVGILSARRPGWLDELLTRTNDVVLALPEVVLALFLVAAFGTGTGTLLLALTVAGWTPFARLARTLTTEVDARGFIEAARVTGCSRWFVVRRHVLPHLAAPLLGQASLRFGQLLISVGALSYLGLGVQPPQSDWGSMLASAQPYASRAPLAVLAPGLTVFVVALCVTVLGQRVSRLDGSRFLVASDVGPRDREETGA